MLRAKRKAAGLTQTSVAARLNKPPSYVAKYEAGDRRLDVLEFLDIAAVIGFDPSRFVRDLLRPSALPKALPPPTQKLRQSRKPRR